MADLLVTSMMADGGLEARKLQEGKNRERRARLLPAEFQRHR